MYSVSPLVKVSFLMFRNVFCQSRWIILTLILLIMTKCKTELTQPGNPLTMKFMTFNIRYDEPGDGENRWINRRDFITEMIIANEVDVIGTQEVLYTQLQDLLTAMPAFSYCGAGRKDGKTEGEYCAILFRKERFQYYNGGTFWLSENPSAIGKKGWDAAIERIVTWVIIKEKLTGAKIAVFNTHFDHAGEVAKKESAKLLLLKINELAGGIPVIVTGDFNSVPDSEPVIILTDKSNINHITDTRSVVSDVTGPGWTYHGFGAVPVDKRTIIDYIFFKNNFTIELFSVLYEIKNNLFLSDHNPVLVKASVKIK